MCLYQKIKQQLYMERTGKMLNKYEKLREDRYQSQAGQSQIWNIQSVRTSKVWLEILELSDEIKSLLYY